MSDIEHLDTKKYEDLKLEYIRRKMAKNSSQQLDDASVGGSTRFTERGDEEERKGTFGRAMDFIFSGDKKEGTPRGEGVQLSSKDLM